MVFMKKTISVRQYQLPLNISCDSDGFVASCSQWSDCYAQGDTIDEVIFEVQSVAASLIELYQEEDKEIPLKLVKGMDVGYQFRLNVQLVISRVSP
jgi:predicted RNase H-like HicB family nuclease